MADFFHMGGYAFYVWASYAVTALVMVGLVVASLRGRRRTEAQLRLLQEAMPGGRRRRGRDGNEA